MNRALTTGLDELMEYEAHGQEIAGASADYQEGMAAFSEKRQANFSGK